MEPEGQVVIPDWLAGADHTSGGCYIPWSPGHRLSSLSTTLPSGDSVLCHLDNTMYSLRPVTLDWSLLTAYFVDGKEMIQQMVASACSKPDFIPGLKKIFWTLDEAPKSLEPSLLELHLLDLNRQVQSGRARLRRARG